MSINPIFDPGISLRQGTAIPVPSPSVPAADDIVEEAAESGLSLFDGEGFSFSEFLDLINPLQHIPVVSTIYRDLTGDEIGAGARVLGSAIFGGIPGIASSLVNLFIEDQTGKDIGEHALALFDSPGSAGETRLADRPAGALTVAQSGKGSLARMRGQDEGQDNVPRTPATLFADDGPVRIAAGKAGATHRSSRPEADPSAPGTRLAAVTTTALPDQVMADIARDAYRASKATAGREAASVSRLA